MKELIAILGAVMTAIVVSCIVLLVFVIHEESNSRDREKALVIATCQDSRILIQRIILRGTGTDYRTYAKDPDSAMSVYRKALTANKFYKRNPDLIDQSVDQTRKILDLADPRKCKKNGRG